MNYATTRWIEDGLGREPTDEEKKENGFEFEFNGKPVCWIGHANVYAWHRYLGMHGDTVECALMALEKWLYDEIENQRSISAMGAIHFRSRDIGGFRRSARLGRAQVSGAFRYGTPTAAGKFLCLPDPDEPGDERKQ